MAIQIPRGKSDLVIERIIESLSDYERDHPDARIDLYRQNPVSVRVRVIDPGFRGQEKPSRNHLLWQYLSLLPEEVQSDISTLLLLTPEETKSSFANLEFEDPVPSQL